jgi:hypothetical protein
MTRPASMIRCSGCGHVADPGDTVSPFPFRCPLAGTDDVDHVLTRVLNPDAVRFPAAPSAPSAPSGGEANPFVRYRTLMHSYHVATARGISDAGYRDLVTSLDAAVADVDGRGFRVTPFFRSAGLSEALGFAAAGGVWV